jgi:hypothetical protein
MDPKMTVCPVASQSADTGGERDQNRPLCSSSHSFVERLIGTIRREYLDRTLFWTTADLENKLLDFQTYFNEASRACWARRANAGTRHAVTAASRRSSLLWLATPLPRPLSHANSCLTLQNSCPWRIAKLA